MYRGIISHNILQGSMLFELKNEEEVNIFITSIDSIVCNNRLRYDGVDTNVLIDRVSSDFNECKNKETVAYMCKGLNIDVCNATYTEDDYTKELLHSEVLGKDVVSDKDLVDMTRMLNSIDVSSFIKLYKLTGIIM